MQLLDKVIYNQMTLLKWIHFIEKAPYILFYNTYSTPFT